MNFKDPYDFETREGLKSIELVQGDITDLDENIDIIVISAFKRAYMPTQGTVIKALNDKGIDVEALSEKPEIDLRESYDVWLSDYTNNPKIKRVACIELLDYSEYEMSEEVLSERLNALFSLITAGAYLGIECKTVALPMIGTHAQELNPDLIIRNLLKSGKSALEKIGSLRKLMLVAYNENHYKIMEKAFDDALRRTEVDLSTFKFNQETLLSTQHAIGELEKIAGLFEPSSRHFLYMLLDELRNLEQKKGYVVNINCRRLLEILISKLYIKIADRPGCYATSLYEKIKCVGRAYGISPVMYSYLTVVRHIGNTSAHTNSNKNFPKYEGRDVIIMVQCLCAFIMSYREIYNKIK